MKFRLDLKPPTVTHHSKRIVHTKSGRTMLNDLPALTTARGTYCALLASHRPPKPMQGALRLTLDFTFPWRKSEKKSIVAKGHAPHVVKPDCSNLAKTLEDCLCTMGFFGNDSQVSELQVSKCYGDSGSVVVTIQTVATYAVEVPEK